jgi:type I restriction enzyme S subunit
MTGGTPPEDDRVVPGGIDVPWYSPGDVGECLRLSAAARTLTRRQGAAERPPLFPADSTLVVGIGDVGRVAHLDHVATGNQQMTCVVPGPELVPRFLSWQLLAMSDEMRAASPSTILAILNNDNLKSMRVRVPPLGQQRAIADYLDAETARIDAVMEKKRRMVDLLWTRFESWREKVMIADQRIAWTPLHHLTDPARPIVYGIVQAGEEVPDGVPYIKTGDMLNLRPDLLSRTSREIDHAYRRARVVPGDIVIAMRASIGLPILVPTDLPVANLTQGTARIAVRRGVDNRWLFHALRCRAVQEQCQVRAVGTTFKTLNIWDLRRINIPDPGEEQYADLAEMVEAKLGQVTKTTGLLNQQLASLVEHRQALISAAVTGQLDIPGLAA